MRFQGAVIREQGVIFAVVVVKRDVLQIRAQADATIVGFRTAFPGMPVVLMAQDLRGHPSYYGRTDIARLLSRVPVQAIPWKEYSLN